MSHSKWTRRQALASLSGSSLALSSCQEDTPEEAEMHITAELLQYAQRLAGLDFNAQERKLMLKRVNKNLDFYKELREVSIDNSVPPAIQFEPIPFGRAMQTFSNPSIENTPTQIPKVPSRLEDLAYCSRAPISKSKFHGFNPPVY